MPVSEYFAPSYDAARGLFRQAAARARAVSSSYEHPERRDPDGKALTIDVARLGNERAECVLLILSGTHGVEGFCGSGCQVGILTDRLSEALPAEGCALLVHALNPYGFAWLRRVNEDGVDLNRNFVDFRQPLPSSKDYEALHPVLVPAGWHGPERERADSTLRSFMKPEAQRSFQSAVTAGQYTRPSGLFYGGTRPTWSAERLADILRNELPASARRVAVIDLHTGLGTPAYGEAIALTETPAELARSRRWYGPEVKDLMADESVSAAIRGSVACGVRAALPDREITYLALEFGTRPMLEVLQALRADHCLSSDSHADPAELEQARQQMRAVFYSESPAWQAAVYGRVADFVFRASRGLAEKA
jgi:predicted deacylase